MAWKALTISSKVNLFVSGTKNQIKAAPIYVNTPKMIYVPYGIAFNISGVT